MRNIEEILELRGTLKGTTPDLLSPGFQVSDMESIPPYDASARNIFPFTSAKKFPERLLGLSAMLLISIGKMQLNVFATTVSVHSIDVAELIATLKSLLPFEDID